MMDPHDFIGLLSTRLKSLAPVATLAMAGLLAASYEVHAQPLGTPLARQLQVGVGAVPGLGLQGGYISPKRVYTVESVLYVYASPRFAGGESDVQVSLGIGSALRPLGLVRSVANAANTSYDLDVGLRIGPGLTFAVGRDETLADKNQRFSLLLEFFARFTTDLSSGRTIFIEGGGHRPFLRAGLWFEL